MCPPARRVVLVGCILLLTVAGIATVTGTPPPTQLCAICGPADAESPATGPSISGSSIPGSTGAGTLEIHVDANGDSRWTERVPVDAAATDRYRDDPDRLKAAVEDAWAHYHAARGDVRDREIAFVADDTREDAGGTVVVTYAVADVARPGIGDAWLVDYFALGESNHRYWLAADRVTIHPPEGAVVTNDPRHASVENGVATWGTDANAFDEQTYVTYGPDDGIVGTAAAYATITREVGPLALKHGVFGGFLATLGIVGAALGVRHVGRDRWFAEMSVETLGRSLAAVGLAGAAVIVVLGALAGGIGGVLEPVPVVLSALGVGYALLTIGASRWGDRLRTRGLIGMAIGATTIVGALAWTIAGPPVYAVPLLFGLATALFVAIGYAFERGSTPVIPIALAALSPIAAVATAAPVGGSGPWLVLVGVFLVPWVAVVVVFGYPLAILGGRLAGGPTHDDGTSTHTEPEARARGDQPSK